MQLKLDLFVPDRFEPLRDRAGNQLSTIIEPVNNALAKVDNLLQDMLSAGRGAFLILRGDSGTGKSTFLQTAHLFRSGYVTEAIGSDQDVPTTLQGMKATTANLRIVALEGREALTDVSVQQIERNLHAINSFLRKPVALNTLIVWTCNAADLEEQLLKTAKTIGADALLGIDEQAYRFRGPSREQYKKIAENTIATLNQGATTADLGVSDTEFDDLVSKSETVGKLLGRLRANINEKRTNVSSLLKTEQCKLWVIVVAGNEPDGDVAALTRGRYSAVDIERLMTATDANVVRELKEYPEKIGILATVLDAKVFHIPMLAALDIVRTYASPELREKMKRLGLSDKKTSHTRPVERLEKTDLGRVFAAGPQGTLATGKKPGSHTQESFKKLANIARVSDVLLNRAIGESLKEAGYIQSYDVEVNLGDGLTRLTDLHCQTESGVVRLEMMWRATTSRAEIANYALTKLFYYGRAIGFLEGRLKSSSKT
jgi:DNA (cytosine-5)-methyltransferase 1